MDFVYVIHDQKYGAQLVCATPSIAEAHLRTGKYDVSGSGATIIPFEVIKEPPTLPKRKQK